MRKITGILLVGAGACSYGVLATIVKYVYGFGTHTSILNFSQFLIGFIILSLLSLKEKKSEQKQVSFAKKSISRLIIYGSSLGLTSIFYYISIQYIPVSVGIILLMQTIWMGVILEAILGKTKIERTKLIGGFVVIAGTLLATNIFKSQISLDVKGVSFGILAAICYTISMYASNSVSLELSSIQRSKYLVLGGLITIILFWNIQIIQHFDLAIMLKWGTFLALFGTIIPPLLFTKGMPITGVGLGSILGAVEIPVSILSANIILGERIDIIQWIGVLIILISVVIINSKSLKTSTN
ncbi:EamA family transporter [Pseudopedobacter beijingensis]|uniref:DMT family transporter n=1 Tax=Pseudopedobacter beijingensis TaxID=1207056 RepID=A0ABW4II90_9SPHI